jgi:superfamily II DNA/RNA helicase
VDAIHDFFAAPDVTFESIGVTSPILLQRLEKLGLSRPSSVQASAYAAIQQGTDVTIGAETGSGKTLAYLLPLVDEILQTKIQLSRTGLDMIFVEPSFWCPTRSLSIKWFAWPHLFVVVLSA